MRSLGSALKSSLFLTAEALLLTTVTFAGNVPTVQLTITPAGPVAAGTAVTLTATIPPGNPAVTSGLLTFCDASAAHCLDNAVIGTAQVSSAGLASMKLVPGVGTHHYQAVLQGTIHYSSAVSSPVALTVTGNGSYLSLSSINSSGNANPYSLTAVVGGFGPSQTRIHLRKCFNLQTLLKPRISCPPTSKSS